MHLLSTSGIAVTEGVATALVTSGAAAPLILSAETGDVLRVAATALAGVLAGVLSALLGVGGAVITTPAVRVLGAAPIEAVGSTVPAILPGAVSGTLRYAREGLVDWRAALGLGISGALFALAGALTSSAVDARLLMVLTAGLMLWSGVTVVRGGRRLSIEDSEGRFGAEELLEGIEASETDTAFVEAPPDAPPEAVPDAQPAAAARVASRGAPLISQVPWWTLGLLGAVSGFVAGLLGVGGGIVMVPMLTGPLRAPIKAAVASSLVAVAIFSVPALVAHTALGHIDWAYALPLMLGVIPGARIGAHLTVGAADRTVRLLFGALIAVLAVVYGTAELLALLDWG